ncbi:uncharacterized protein EDB93DRAFT_1164777 [Suillus bovinus]|uniref:uncharacterized protein n=1 Tax=Suillus bovinus TaxID=48563 RepID=UPI001B86FE04|nr:uncharacterized protein EDB93DRAFT_1164777 [Suillus bovinus]KAG2138578.1 hypothetical protein EDB93DRAFT_1164777 [Suillus bovinus]
MSETPPKPKPGSLRDRIAAFENANKSAAPAPAGPAPRPKPSTLQSWKPKVPSPPQSPESERKTAGMSASDAMESIGRGGSLKERMAALQGKTNQGWKPPPPVLTPADEAVSQDGAIDPQGSSPPATGDPDSDPTDLKGEHEAQQDAAEIEQDPEEEERQRRAAIAARMARLGGARVGMGPPLFAKPSPKKPATPPPQPKQDEEATLPDSEVTSPPAETISPPADVREEVQTDPGHFPAPTHKDSDSSSLSLADSSSNASTTRSMPVPAGPRRAAPPRKKAYKSPPVSQLSEVPVVHVAPDVSEEAPDAEPAEEPAASIELEPELEPEARPSVATVTSQEVVQSPEHVPVTSAEQILAVSDVQKEIGEVGVSIELDTAEVDPTDKLEEENYRVDADEPAPEQQDREKEEQEQEQEQEEQEQEGREQEQEEEEARRQRVAAKLAQMGAFNPFAGPPPVLHQDSISSPTARRDSITVQPVSVEEPLDIGEATPSPPAHSPPRSHVEEELEQAKEVREVDEPASCAAEFDHGSQPDLGATHRMVRDRLLNEPGTWEPASQPYTLDTPLREYEPSQGDPNQPGHNLLAPDLTPDQHQDDDDEMAPARITRPIPPPPVNLVSKPSITPSSSPPPPPPKPLYALQADEERPESPAPRPVPPPVKSGT